MKERIDKLRNLGITSNLTSNEATKVKMVNTIFLISIVFCSILSILTTLFGYYSFSILMLATLALMVVGMYLMSQKKYQIVYNSLVIGLTIFFVISNLFLGNVSDRE